VSVTGVPGYGKQSADQYRTHGVVVLTLIGRPMSTALSCLSYDQIFVGLASARVSTVTNRGLLTREAVVAAVSRWKRAANLSEQLGDGDPVTITSGYDVRRHTGDVSARDTQPQVCRRISCAECPAPAAVVGSCHFVTFHVRNVPVQLTEVEAPDHVALLGPNRSCCGFQVSGRRVDLQLHPHSSAPVESPNRTDQTIQEGRVVVAMVRLAF